jgi:hypothetical protein
MSMCLRVGQMSWSDSRTNVGRTNVGRTKVAASWKKTPFQDMNNLATKKDYLEWVV